MKTSKGGRPEFVHNTHIGQNFLVDRSILTVILDRVGLRTDDVVLEVGPGQGALTEGLLASECRLVHAVEIDRRLEPYLREIRDREGERFLLHWGDAVRFDYTSLTPLPNRVVANIPYHITTPLIWKLLEDLAARGLEYLLLMVQKEAADRICGLPGTKERYPLGITLEAMGKARIVRRIPPTVFRPQPRVDSALLEIRLERCPLLPADGFWRKLVAGAFSQRRKTLANNLLKALGFPREDTVEILARRGLGPSIRAEQLDTSQWLDCLEEFRERFGH